VISVDPGNYTIDYKFTAHAPSDCSSPQNLGPNSTFFGNLGGGNPATGQDDGQPLGTYGVHAFVAGMTGIFMTSTDGEQLSPPLTDARVRCCAATTIPTERPMP